MEYLGNCPKCKHHTIVETVKQIVHEIIRNPQRKAKCVNCGELSRITIIGEVHKPEHINTNPNPEFASSDKLILKVW